MSIIFGAICPHPPILVPEVGGAESTKIKKTKEAMEKLTEELAKTEPETLIVISPHGLVYPDRINICGMNKLCGDLGYFGASQVAMKFENDLELAGEINRKADETGIKNLLYDNGQEFYQLDHGILVPLYFLTKKFDHPIKLVPIAYSYQDRDTHFKFGKIIYSLIANRQQLTAVIASGDLSHRLLPTAPAGYSPEGKKFDRELIEALSKKDINTILNLDQDLIEEAGECGYRSILILLGILNGLKWKPEILSYEGPFGVGYLVANFKLKT